MSRLQALVEKFEQERNDIVAEIEYLAGIDSKSGDIQGITRCVQSIAASMEGLLSDHTFLDTPSGPVFHGDFGTGGKTALILAHSDTVWPADAANKPPLQDEGTVLRGPGVLDMKGSIIMARRAMMAIRALEIDLPVTYRFMVTPDEEIGSINSSALITEQARGVAAAFVPEPAQYTSEPFGAIKRSRKGGAKFQVKVIGRESHAGTNPEDGINAIHEAVPVLSKIAGLNKPSAGRLCNATVIHGGTAANAIPGEVVIDVDSRFGSEEAREIILSTMDGLGALTERAAVEVNCSAIRPPMVFSQATGELVGLYQRIAAEIGIDISERDTGGGSDGNYTSSVGVPTLDGIGLDGGGAHTADEHVNLDTLPVRFALFTEILIRYGEELQ